MADRKQNTTKNRQKNAETASDHFAQRSESDDAEEKITSDHGETLEKTGFDQLAELPKSCNFGLSRVGSAPGFSCRWRCCKADRDY